MVAAPETKVIEQSVEKTVQATEKVVEKGETTEMEVEVLTDDQKAENMTKCSNLMAEGKKYLMQNKPQDAVTAFADGCALMRTMHGELDVPMCEFYFYYGKALLEVARIEEDVLGHALAGVPEGEDADNSQVEDPEKLSSEEREEVAQKVDEALEENLINMEKPKEDEKSENVEAASSEAKDDKPEEKDTEVKSDAAKTEEKSEETKNGDVAEPKEATNGEAAEPKETEDSEKMETAQDETKEGEADAEEEDEEEGDATDVQDDEEDVPSIQLAFEVLDLARVIYTQKEDRTKEESVKLSQVYLKLGEVAMENENFTDAVTMYQDCLELQKTILSADDRWLAETHYQLCVAHTMASDYDEGLKHANGAIDVIKCRVDNLTKQLAKDEITVTADLDSSKLTEEQQTAAKDIRELQTLLPELEAKVTDITESKATTVKKIETLLSGFSSAISGGISGKSAFEDNASEGFGTDSSPKPTAMSSSLIRKKRKPEEEVTSPDASKKQKTDEETTA